MDEETAVQAALLEWINDFDISHHISSMVELSDGLIMWRLLCQIDAQHFSGELPNPNITDQDYWLPKWQNLKKINKDVTRYLMSRTDKLVLRDDVFSPDLKMIAVAEESSPGETVKVDAFPQTIVQYQADVATQLLKMILLATINSPKANNYLARMTKLSVPAQAAIRSIIEEMALLSNPSENDDDVAVNEPPRSVHVDHELLLEEQLAKVVAANHTLHQERAELQNMITRLEDRVERLQKENVDLKAKGEHDPDFDMKIQELKRKVQDQEDVIARQEVIIAKLQSETEVHKKMIDNLRSSSTSMQQLRDTCDELRAERDILMRKANTIDRYRQKLEAMQAVEDEAQELRAQYEDLRQQADRAEEHSQGLEMTIEKYRETLETVEKQNYELQTVKRQFELENKLLTERSENLAEETARNLEVISGLQERISELDATKGPKDENADLHSQLQTGDDGVTERSEVEGETTPRQSRNKESIDGQVVMLQKLLEDAKLKSDRLEKLYLDAEEKIVVLENKIRTISTNTATAQGSSHLGQRPHNQIELSTMRTKVISLEAELAETKSKLAAAVTDLDIIDPDKLKALREIKDSKFPELKALRDERSRLQELVKTMLLDLDQQRSLLNRTFLDKDAAQTSLLAAKDALRAAEGPRKDSAQIRLNIAAPDMDAWYALEKRLLEGQERAALSRADLVKDVERQNQMIAELQEQLRQERDQRSTTATDHKAQQTHDEEVTNLQRENRLIASAWYDLNSRLQTSHVELQRKREEPRSWIKKQRQVVNNATR